jgi:hypothetical protein
MDHLHPRTNSRCRWRNYAYALSTLLPVVITNASLWDTGRGDEIGIWACWQAQFQGAVLVWRLRITKRLNSKRYSCTGKHRLRSYATVTTLSGNAPYNGTVHVPRRPMKRRFPRVPHGEHTDVVPDCAVLGRVVSTVNYQR